MDFLNGPFLIWLPRAAYFIFIALAVHFYLSRSRFGGRRTRVFQILSFGFICYRIAEAILKTVLQYYVWAGNKFTSIWLTSGYLIDYSYRRFWLNLFLSLLVALVFLAILQLLRRFKDRFFEEGEVELGFFSALVAGWPNFLVFVPATFFILLILSVIRKMFFKENYTTLGPPLLSATVIVALFGEKLLNLLKLGLFKI